MLGRLDFGERWMGWIRQCLISTHIFVLVNGNPTEEIAPQKGSSCTFSIYYYGKGAELYDEGDDWEEYVWGVLGGLEQC